MTNLMKIITLITTSALVKSKVVMTGYGIVYLDGASDKLTIYLEDNTESPIILKRGGIYHSKELFTRFFVSNIGADLDGLGYIRLGIFNIASEQIIYSVGNDDREHMLIEKTSTGTSLTYSFTDGYEYTILGGSIYLKTDANTANRYVAFVIYNGGTGRPSVIYVGGNGVAQAANLDYLYNLCSDVVSTATAVATGFDKMLAILFPRGIIVKCPYYLICLISSVQADDTVYLHLNVERKPI